MICLPLVNGDVALGEASLASTMTRLAFAVEMFQQRAVASSKQGPFLWDSSDGLPRLAAFSPGSMPVSTTRLASEMDPKKNFRL